MPRNSLKKTISKYVVTRPLDKGYLGPVRIGIIRWLKIKYTSLTIDKISAIIIALFLAHFILLLFFSNILAENLGVIIYLLLVVALVKILKNQN